MKIIPRFQGKYKFLSNFFNSPLEYEGFTYPSVEHAYQERKTNNPGQREWIREARTAFGAAQRGRSKEIEIREDWLEIIFLMEGNHWHDNYFGVCTCKKCENIQGQNQLGQILMKVRDEFINRREGN